MSLQLDARQRAMLGEFGIRFYEPLRPAQLPVIRPAQLPVIRPPPPPAALRVVSTSLPMAAVVPPTGSRPMDEVPEFMAVQQEPVRSASQVDSPGTGNEGLLALPAGIEAMPWDMLAQTVAQCRACKLCQSRRNTVFGAGDRQADWLIVGEAPGENEDLQGEPFVGQAGKLLDNMLKALGLDRQTRVYITNVLKCRPPGNRNPERDEVAQCEHYLRRQVALLQPKIILAMGRFAVQSLLQTGEPIGKLRGRPHQYSGVPVVVTYHPAYLLRNLPEKAKAWADLCFAQELFERSGQVH